MPLLSFPAAFNAGVIGLASVINVIVEIVPVVVPHEVLIGSFLPALSICDLLVPGPNLKGQDEMRSSDSKPKREKCVKFNQIGCSSQCYVPIELIHTFDVC